jgi:uncharacterized small protein (DUF1192 family)
LQFAAAPRPARREGLDDREDDAMASDLFGEDRPRPKPAAHEIGQDLSLLSIDEIDERIALLEQEIERLRAARARKEASRTAAGAFFKP